jgi:hypothetical protein
MITRHLRAGRITKPEGRPPLVLADVAQREPEPLPLHAHGDQPDAGPGVEPAVEQPELGRARRELEEAEGGAEPAAAGV